MRAKRGFPTKRNVGYFLIKAPYKYCTVHSRRSENFITTRPIHSSSTTISYCCAIRFTLHSQWHLTKYSICLCFRQKSPWRAGVPDRVEKMDFSDALWVMTDWAQYATWIHLPTFSYLDNADLYLLGILVVLWIWVWEWSWYWAVSASSFPSSCRSSGHQSSPHSKLRTPRQSIRHHWVLCHIIWSRWVFRPVFTLITYITDANCLSATVLLGRWLKGNPFEIDPELYA